MYCLHPIEVAKWAELPDGTKRKTANKRLVPCGKCVACLSRLRNSWTYRLTMEQENSSYSYFVTLTYSDEHLPGELPGCEFSKPDVQKYIKRVRYFMNELNQDLKCTYYCISEFGSTTLRPHYHMLFFVKNDNEGKYKRILPDALRDCWQLGYSVVKSTTPANIHYVTKYSVKSLNADYFNNDNIRRDKPFVLCSKMRYIGAAVEDQLDYQCSSEWFSPGIVKNNNNSSVVYLNGQRLPMPRIYREKLGVSSDSQPLSIDPRLSVKKYNKWKDDYTRKNGAFDERMFQEYINNRFYAIEQNAIRHQIKKLEKL